MAATGGIQCHYAVLGVAKDAEASVIKKAHRKLALKHHPDKNQGNAAAAEEFRLVQQAYEVLSNPQERKWYDDHRDAILAGWSAGGNEDSAASSMLFDIVPYMHPGCYKGYHDKQGGFFDVYARVFEQIVQCERRQSEATIELPTDFGTSKTDWSNVQRFYQTWESFASQLNFAWEDKYNINEDAPNRRVRRLMEEENKKARRNAKRTYNQDILTLVAFVKRRDPRVKAKQQELEKQKQEQTEKLQQRAAERKREKMKAKEMWREQTQGEMEDLEEADRLAGRVRLVDLEDDYDYGGGKKKGKKKKNKRKMEDDNEAGGQAEDMAQPCDVEESELENPCLDNQNASGNDRDVTESDLCNDNHKQNDDVNVFPLKLDKTIETEELPVGRFSNSEEDEEDEPELWLCECCKKDFKSAGQMNNHMKSKKHKENFKKYQAKINKQEEEIMVQMMDEVDLES